MFGKKKKEKEKKQSEPENETTENEKLNGSEISDGNDGTLSNRNNSEALDLKPTVIIAVIAIISVVCAFIFVSKMNSSPNDGVLDVEEIESNERTLETAPGNVPEKKTDKTKKEEKKKGKENDVEKYDNESENESEIEMQGNIIVPLESIVVNLGGVGSRRYLRVLINLEVENEKAQDKIKEKIVMLRDKMISLLSAKSAKEIETEGSLLRLRLEIKNILNEVLGTGDTIKQVYFSDFIIQ